MAIFWQPKPEGFTQYTLPKLDRTKLKSVRMDLDAEDYELLDRLTKFSGLRNRTRFLRWLIWMWKGLEDVAWSGESGKAVPVPVWTAQTEELYVGVVRVIREEGKERRVVRMVVPVPDGWKKG